MDNIQTLFQEQLDRIYYLFLHPWKFKDVLF